MRGLVRECRLARGGEGAGNFQPVPTYRWADTRRSAPWGGQNGVFHIEFAPFWHIRFFLLILELILHGIRIQGKGAASGGAPSCLADWDSF